MCKSFSVILLDVSSVINQCSNAPVQEIYDLMRILSIVGWLKKYKVVLGSQKD